jgi:putative ABC transport system permease protein
VLVTPYVDGVGRAYLDGHSSDAEVSGIAYNHRRLPERLVDGSGFSSDSAGELIAHEYLLYRWGLRDDDVISAAVGKPVRLELSEGRRTPLSLLSLFNADTSSLTAEDMRVLDKAWKLLPGAIKGLEMTEPEKAHLQKLLDRKPPGDKKDAQKRVSTTLTLVGVIRSPPKDEKRRDNEFLDGPLRDAEILLPLGTADALFGQMPSRQRQGYTRARIVVDREENIKSVVDQIKAMGLHEFSMGLIIEQIKVNVAIISFGMNFIALIALVVAAVGITNTLFTSVLERTREIGVMKAVGAKDRHVLTIFLIEGTLLGLVGGLGGILLGWLVSLPGDATARSLMAEQTGEPAPLTMFLFPPWLLIGVPVFALTVTTLAAALPARRAARIHPVEALRYE